MRVVWSWLKELAKLDPELSAEDAAARLTAGGMEVETIEHLGEHFSGVVVAKVLAKTKHPNADKLSLVDIDGGKEKATVVCGAPNVPEPGKYVLWAAPGAELPGFTITPKKIKGVTSPGMLCSEVELEIGDDSSGILVLDNGIPGQTAQEALGLDDIVFEISVPANRGDCLGHLGIARELLAAASGDLVLRVPPVVATGEALPVKIHDTERCHRYTVRVLRGLKVGPSPAWVQARLRAVGVRPISNIVDVTNYVMFELGQPLHAFDARGIEKIDIRAAKDGEVIRTLDDVERKLTKNDLVIAQGDKALALAGVMGGASSEVQDDTTDVILESAHFDATGVRKTARRLGLHSESSGRFSRGVDAQGVALASARAAELLLAWCGGKAEGFTDHYPVSAEENTVSLRVARLVALSGIEFTAEQATECLEKLGIKVSGDGELLACTPPTYRSDLHREVDLIEEVVRMYGFDKLPTTLPSVASVEASSHTSRSTRVRDALVAGGWNEVITYGFTSEEKLAPFADPAKAIVVQNPMNASQKYMRPSLLPNLLAAAVHNQRHGQRDITMFELGSVFLAPKGQDPAALTDLAQEPTWVVGLCSGEQQRWLAGHRPYDFYDAKGALECAMEALECSLTFTRTESSFLHPGASAAVMAGNQEIGFLGELHPDVVKAVDLHGQAFVFGVCLDALAVPGPKQMMAISKFPAVTRDLSVLVNSDIQAGDILQAVDEVGHNILESFDLVEVYDDPAHIPQGKKALLWSATYRGLEQTLTDEIVDKAHGSVVDEILARFDAVQR